MDSVSIKLHYLSYPLLSVTRSLLLLGNIASSFPSGFLYYFGAPVKSGYSICIFLLLNFQELMAKTKKPQNRHNVCPMLTYRTNVCIIL